MADPNALFLIYSLWRVHLNWNGGTLRHIDWIYWIWPFTEMTKYFLWQYFCVTESGFWKNNSILAGNYSRLKFFSSMIFTSIDSIYNSSNLWTHFTFSRHNILNRYRKVDDSDFHYTTFSFVATWHVDCSCWRTPSQARAGHWRWRCRSRWRPAWGGLRRGWRAGTAGPASPSCSAAAPAQTAWL